ncbi:2-thiouracil desulfurase family protein [Cytobacillus kochii]
MIVVSACLAGMNVRYNGSNSLDERIQKLLLENQAMTVCPELLGGFTTPREPAEIVGGDGEDVLDGKAKVIEKSGKDVTKQYINGAYATLKKAQELGATTIILKENSPSCGSSVIYNGAFKGEQIVGNGVTTALLRKNGFKVISENNFNEYSILEIN